MTDFATARQSIDDLFEAQYSETRVSLENVDFDPGTDAEYVELRVLEGPGEQISINSGAAQEQHGGLVQIDCLVRQGLGSKRPRELAEIAGSVFRRVTLGDVLFRVPYIDPLPDPPEGFFGVAVTIPFIRFHTP